MEENEMTAEEMQQLPWDYPAILLVPGRYYLAYGFIQIDPGFTCKFGSDAIGCIWRYDHEPNVWRIIIRTRRYVEEDGDPFKDEDVKKWFPITHLGKEEEVFKKADGAIRSLGIFFAGLHRTKFHEPDWVWLKGDCNKAIETLANCGKEWMHIKVETHIT